MKILFVDLQYDYGLESRGKNHIGQDGFLKAFEELGHEVKTFYYDKYLNDRHLLQGSLKKRSKETNPDLIFFSLFSDQFEISTLEYLKSQYITINWFGDDQWRFDSFTSTYAQHFSYCITTDKYSGSKYRAAGQENVIYSQWAAIQSYTIPEFKGYKYDVSFVGGWHPYRKWLFDKLKEKGIDIHVFGNGWKKGSLSSEEMTSLFVSSKINLNVGNSVSFDGRYLLSGIRPFINSFRSPKVSSQIKARNFEIPYFNGFQMTDYAPSIDQYFSIGKEIICYNDIDSIEMLIKYYLRNDLEREAIKAAGHKRSVKEHGYTNRIKQILESVI